MKPRTALALQLLDVLDAAHELGFEVEAHAWPGRPVGHVSVSFLLSENGSRALPISQTLGLSGDAWPSIMGGTAAEIAIKAGVIDRENLSRWPSAREGREYLERAVAEKCRRAEYEVKLDAQGGPDL